MSLTAAYEVIRASLTANGVATSVLSRNIANADSPYNARKTAISINQTGMTGVSSINNSVDHVLLENAIAKTSSLESTKALSGALDKLNSAFGDPAQGRNLSSLIASLRSALQLASSTPNDENLARAAIESANEVAKQLRDSRTAVEELRFDANATLVEAASSLDSILGAFAVANEAIVSGSARGADVTDYIDLRNKLIFEMAELLDIKTITRENNDVVLLVSGDITLFESTPRTLNVSAGAPLQPGQPANPPIIDGLAINGDHQSKLGGKMGAALQIRDQVGILAGSQLDEIARGLIEMFAEADQIGSGPALPGLFTSPSTRQSIPNSRADGLALLIEVNKSVDPTQGGVVSRLRDGGISEPFLDTYKYNQSGTTGFSDRLLELKDKLVGHRQFDVSAGLDQSTDILSYSAASVGWLQS